jgi:putative hydrolase of the HAD superfamily
MYEVLDNLKSHGIILGIITNGSPFSQNRKIDALGIREYLSTIIISDSVNVKKPDEKIFAIALEEINVSASDTWYIGDHPVNDILRSSSAENNNEAGAATRVGLISHECFPKGSDNL